MAFLGAALIIQVKSKYMSNDILQCHKVCHPREGEGPENLKITYP